MAQKSRSNNKANFQTGDIPNQSNYSDLIDSFAVLTNDTNSGSLTLSGSLITSGSINHNGSTTFGDSITDTHTITGNITASGDISSSGTIVGNVATFTSYTNANFGSSNISTTGTSTFNNITASGNISASGADYTFGTTRILNGHITASGNISGSLTSTVTIGGALTAGAGTLTSLGVGAINSTSHITASGDISSSGKIYSSEYFKNGVELFSNPSFAGNITASSGNISASGDIFASRYHTDGFISLNTDGTQGRVFGDGSITGIQIGRDGTPDKNIELLGPVTASGDISSSGTVTGNNGSFNDITYGGTDLSVSATELNSWENLTSAEASQVKNIGNATIDATQWSYVGEMDQRITQASTVNFAGVTLDKTTSVSANYVLGEVEMSAPAHNFVLTLTNAPSLAPDEASDLFEVKQNNRVVATSTIIGTVFEEALVVQCSAVVDGGFRFNLVNRRSAYGGGSIKINFIVL